MSLVWAMADAFGFRPDYTLYKMTIPQIIALLDKNKERNEAQNDEPKRGSGAKTDEENLPSVDQFVSFVKDSVGKA